jgi:hypothetical protein
MSFGCRRRCVTVSARSWRSPIRSAPSISTPSTRRYAAGSWRSSRKRPSPLERGDLRIWAAGAIYALGVNSFLFDPSQTPHLSAGRLSDLLKVRKTRMAGKAKRIRDVLDLDAQMDVEFCRLELLEDHPLAWLVEVNGMIVDARSLPAELQAEARRRELIADIPLGEAA